MKYFTIDELIHSNTAERLGIDNTPDDEIQSNLRRLIEMVLDPLREEVGVPLIISSGYRCAELNKAVGGKPTSQHQQGLAADIVCHRMPVRQLYETAIRLSDEDEIWADQIILEFGRWVHISTAQERRKMYFEIGTK